MGVPQLPQGESLRLDCAIGLAGVRQEGGSLWPKEKRLAKFSRQSFDGTTEIFTQCRRGFWMGQIGVQRRN